MMFVAAEGYSAGACVRGHPQLTISLDSKRFAVSRTSLSTATHGLSTVALLSFSAHEALYNKNIWVHEGSKSFLSHRSRHTVCNEDTVFHGSNKQLDGMRKRQDCLNAEQKDCHTCGTPRYLSLLALTNGACRFPATS